MAATLAGCTTLVAGATSEIGRETALQLADRGAEVVVLGRSAERGAKTVREIENSGGKARFIATDLDNADDVRRLAAEAEWVDILINNAGIYKFGGTTDTDEATFNEHVNINLRAVHPGPAIGTGDDRAERRGRLTHPGSPLCRVCWKRWRQPPR